MGPRSTNLTVLCTCCALHMLPIAYRTVSQKPLLITYGIASHCTCCLMQHLHSPLGGVWQHRVSPRISATSLSYLNRPPCERIGWDRMLLISNSFQYPSICNKMGLIFDSAKSCDNSNSPIVLPCIWQMRPWALTKPLLNQQIVGGKSCWLLMFGKERFCQSE